MQQELSQEATGGVELAFLMTFKHLSTQFQNEFVTKKVEYAKKFQTYDISRQLDLYRQVKG